MQDAAVQLDSHEHRQIEKLRLHSVFSRSSRSKAYFIEILIQRRFFSLEFTKIYDVLLEAVVAEPAKRVIRRIIREEYPSGAKSHREDLVDDICKLGVSRDFIRQKKSAHTRLCLNELDQYVEEILTSHQSSIASIAFLRFWGEVLTAVEYDIFWGKWLHKRLSKSGESELPMSKFYWFHFDHDRKLIPFSQRAGKGSREKPTHADELAGYLAKEIANPSVLELVKDIETRAADLKMSFYDQF